MAPVPSLQAVGPVKDFPITEQDRILADAALRRAMADRIPDVEAVAQAIANSREEGWRACLDRITNPEFRKAIDREQ